MAYFVSSDSGTYTETLRLRRTLGNYPYFNTSNYINHKKMSNIECIHNSNVTSIGEEDFDYFNIISDYTTANMENCLNEIVYSYSTQPVYTKPALISVKKYDKNETIQNNLCMMRPTVRGMSANSRAAHRRICNYGKKTTDLTDQYTCDSAGQGV